MNFWARQKSADDGFLSLSRGSVTPRVHQFGRTGGSVAGCLASYLLGTSRSNETGNKLPRSLGKSGSIPESGHPFQRSEDLLPQQPTRLATATRHRLGGLRCLALLTLLGALGVVAISGCAHDSVHAQAGTVVRFHEAPLPSFKHLPHYMGYRQCDPFSKEAVAMLQERGIPARRIFYRWHVGGGETGEHAAVLFQFNGKFYFMDNARMGPRVVAGKTDLGCVHHITERWDCLISMVNEQGERIAPRKMADLFAPPPEWMKSIQVGAQ